MLLFIGKAVCSQAAFSAVKMNVKEITFDQMSNQVVAYVSGLNTPTERAAWKLSGESLDEINSISFYNEFKPGIWSVRVNMKKGIQEEHLYQVCDVLNLQNFRFHEETYTPVEFIQFLLEEH